jgi:hypothetical protein
MGERMEVGGRLLETDADGLGKASEERGFFPGWFGWGEWVAGSGAIGAEESGLAALDSERADAIAAEGLFAAGAFDDSWDAGVEETGERTVEEMGLDGVVDGRDIGDGDADVFGWGLEFDDEFGGAESEDLAGFKDGFLDGFAVDEGAVGGAEVADEDGVAADDEFAMEAGGGGVGDAEIVGRVAAEADEAIGQLDGTWVGDSLEHQFFHR